MNGTNILNMLTQQHYDEVGWVLNEHGYMVEPGEAITPGMLADALSDKGFDMAADIANTVNELGGQVSIDEIMDAITPGMSPYVEDNLQMGQHGLFISWDALGWAVAILLLLLLLFRK